MSLSPLNFSKKPINMLTYFEVYMKWINETSEGHENSDFYDSDKMINQFGRMVPCFFFRFLWKENQTNMHLNIRSGILDTNTIVCVDSVEELRKYIEFYNLNNSTFHLHALAATLPEWWLNVLTATEISFIKQKREKKIEQLIKSVVRDIKSKDISIRR